MVLSALWCQLKELQSIQNELKLQMSLLLFNVYVMLVNNLTNVICTIPIRYVGEQWIREGLSNLYKPTGTGSGGSVVMAVGYRSEGLEFKSHNDQAATNGSMSKTLTITCSVGFISQLSL